MAQSLAFGVPELNCTPFPFPPLPAAAEELPSQTTTAGGRKTCPIRPDPSARSAICAVTPRRSRYGGEAPPVLRLGALILAGGHKSDLVFLPSAD